MTAIKTALCVVAVWGLLEALKWALGFWPSFIVAILIGIALIAAESKEA